jgi:GDP-4-dehydro-6-deoxy-D-mannose reductase
MMRVLVTGAQGFVGGYLADALRRDDHEVWGFDTRGAFRHDIRDYEAVHSMISRAEPDLIFHLAAVAWPGESLRDPRRVMDVNLGGTANLLDAVRVTGSHAKILLAGTSEEYGYEGHPEGTVLDEETTCRPMTPYGVSKLAATTLGMVYARRYGLHVVATRAFNHTGWGRQAVNAESSFARRIVAFERGETTSVSHGDLSAMRNFTDVRDVVRAYKAVILADPGIYNVCSGNTVTMQQVMDTLVEIASEDSRTPVILKEDPALVHKDAGIFPIPTFDKLHQATAWIPEISLEETLKTVLEYWRGR